MYVTESGCNENTSDAVEMLLLGFQQIPQIHFFLFLMFLFLYTLTIAGNILVVFIVTADVCLYMPMYFFLGNLAVLELCYSTTIVPNMLKGLLTGDNTISFAGCMTQMYFYGWLVDFECVLLTLMAYDRYLAICHPLHYTMRMTRSICQLMVITSWVGSCIPSCINLYLMCMVKFYGKNEIDHFFCDIAPLVNVACSDTTMITINVYILSTILLLTTFLSIIISYVCIIRAILRIPSSSGQHKAFVTCSSHLTVVCIFFGTLIIIYMFPTEGNAHDVNKGLSMLYTMVTPLLNPLIYTFRNKDIRDAFRKLSTKISS